MSECAGGNLAAHATVHSVGRRRMRRCDPQTGARSRVVRNERSVGLEVRQNADDGLRKVLIEGEQARHMRALSCCQRRVQVLGELPLQVECVLNRRRFYVRVQPVDLGLLETALGERAESLGL